jgi:AcrR family transcriptional regulator
MTGLRERKKQQTRQHIADVAIGLFLERGFDEVTVAEVAEAADVSVNTVYNYFPAKEDLFFDRAEETAERPSRRVRERAPGESAAEALFRGLREDIEQRSPWIGLNEGYDRFIRTAIGSPALMRRMMFFHRATTERLAATLREEAGAAPDDVAPDLIGAQLMTVQQALLSCVMKCIRDHGSVDEAAGRMLRMLAEAETLLSRRVLDYARRPAAPDGAAAPGAPAT